MSTQENYDTDKRTASEFVINYLRTHPDFFTQNSDLLANMQIPHLQGTAISLIEKQVSVLRDENNHLQRKLENLVAIAKQNEQINKRVQRLLVALTGSLSADEFFDILYESLQTEFSTEAVMLRLFEEPVPSMAGRPEFVEYDAQIFALFESLLSSGKPVCGRLSSGQVEYLFPQQKILSAVLIPLGIPKPQGILAMGSDEVSRFHAGMATDLLKYMGELISQLLNMWLRQH